MHKSSKEFPRLADSCIKVAKNFHNYLQYKVFLSQIFDGVLVRK